MVLHTRNKKLKYLCMNIFTKINVFYIISLEVRHMNELNKNDLDNIFKNFFSEVKIEKDKIESFSISKNDAKAGTIKKFKYSTTDICDECNGVKRESICKKCHDTGSNFTEKEIILNIPPKVKNNDYLVLVEKGNQIKSEQRRGDLYIKLHIYGDKSKRKGREIYL